MNRMSELAHVNRFSTAGELTASIAHEINQPLAAILSNIEALQMMLKSPAPDLGEIQEIADTIWRDDMRASQVIEHLRNLLKKRRLSEGVSTSTKLFGGAIELVSGQAVRRKVDLRSTIGPAPLPIMGDRIQLEQVIINLIVNAIDAMSDTPAREREITIFARRRDEFAEVMIADSGPGLPPDKLQEVFQPFFTTKGDGGWGWDCRSRGPLSRRTTERYGQITKRGRRGVPDKITASVNLNGVNLEYATAGAVLKGNRSCLAQGIKMSGSAHERDFDRMSCLTARPNFNSLPAG